MTQAKAAFCPICGAASVDRNLVARTAKCRVCTWQGPDYELASMLFEHEAGTDEEMLHSFFLDMRSTLGEHFAKEIALFLSRWGFLGPGQPKLLARYLAASSRAMILALVEERDRIEKEQHGRSS